MKQIFGPVFCVKDVSEKGLDSLLFPKSERHYLSLKLYIFIYILSINYFRIAAHEHQSSFSKTDFSEINNICFPKNIYILASNHAS